MQSARGWAVVCLSYASALALWGAGRLADAAGAACPRDMVDTGVVCVDRYETSLIDQATREPLSPYYPPEIRWLRQVYDNWELLRRTAGDEPARRMPLPAISDLQRRGTYVPAAQSEPDRVPQGYLSFYSAKRACEVVGKRLCSEDEWKRACRGEHDTLFPYGPKYQANVCNVGSYQHPASVLHGLSSSGHLDPRLNLLTVAGKEPVLGRTGTRTACKSSWGNDAIYDMVGNLDEWVSADPPVFRGGFYARGTTKGCDSEVRNHGAPYFDYSTGTRCCRDRAR